MRSDGSGRQVILPVFRHASIPAARCFPGLDG
jgi:hypothetical protein